MPRGIYLRTPEHCRNISEALKGRHICPDTEFKKGHEVKKEWIESLIERSTGREPWNKDKKYPEFSGKNHVNWKGGRTLSSQGYVLISEPNHPFAYKDGYIAEHRFIMEKIIGRYLTPIERVHHLNGIKTDNRKKNLRYCKNESEHQSYHH